MRSSLALLAALGLALAVVGCQRAPEAPPAARAPAADDVALAKAALAVADWARAAPHLRAALQKDPQSLFLHYNLAICATWLDLKAEAIREFGWVVDHAPSDSDEARTARKWLAENNKDTSTEVAASQTDPTVGDSGVHGVVLWGDPATPQGRQQLVLGGLHGTPTQGMVYVRRADREGRYEFKNIPPGTYKLSAEVPKGPGGWRLKVELRPGDDLVLDLTPDNSTARRDDFPPG